MAKSSESGSIKKKAGAFFDLEKTITSHAVEQVIALEYFRRGELKLSQVLKVAWIYLRYDLGFIADFESMKRSGAPVFLGRDHERDKEQARLFFEEKLKKAIYPEALDIIKSHKEKGDEVWIVSATYDFMVAPFADHLGVNGFFGPSLEVENGLYTGRITGRIPHQEVKAQLVREVIEERDLDVGESHAYGDSMNDAAMLGVVGHGHAINPGKKLRQLAESRSWKVHKWGH